MLDFLFVVTIGILIGILIGSAVNERALGKEVEFKSEKTNRAAICIGGKFYYVVPEKEYVDTALETMRLRQLDRTLADALLDIYDVVLRHNRPQFSEFIIKIIDTVISERRQIFNELQQERIRP